MITSQINVHMINAVCEAGRQIWVDQIDALWRKRRIVWLSGVRRIGKTCLCRQVPAGSYLNCDLPSVQRQLALYGIFLSASWGWSPAARPAGMSPGPRSAQRGCRAAWATARKPEPRRTRASLPTGPGDMATSGRRLSVSRPTLSPQSRSWLAKSSTLEARRSTPTQDRCAGAGWTRHWPNIAGTECHATAPSVYTCPKPHSPLRRRASGLRGHGPRDGTDSGLPSDSGRGKEIPARPKPGRDPYVTG